MSSCIDAESGDPSFAPSLFDMQRGRSTVARARGTMNLSGATILMDTFKTLSRYAGADICLRALILAGIRLISRRFQNAVCALFGSEAPGSGATLDWC